jgi:hypothetical protein
VFPTNNSYKSSDVCKRVKFISSAFNDKGNKKIQFSSDADPRLKGAMKFLTNFGVKFEVQGLCTFFICNPTLFECLNDSYHHLNNMKNQMT